MHVPVRARHARTARRAVATSCLDADTDGDGRGSRAWAMQRAAARWRGAPGLLLPLFVAALLLVDGAMGRSMAGKKPKAGQGSGSDGSADGADTDGNDSSGGGAAAGEEPDSWQRRRRRVTAPNWRGCWPVE